MRKSATVPLAGGQRFDQPEVSIAPLIDISFLLLIFFLVTTTILRRERDLPMQVPGPPAVAAVPPTTIAIGVENDGRIVLNPGVGEIPISSDPEQRELALLEEHVQMIRSVAGEREVAVQLLVGAEARQQRVVDVLNCLAGLGVPSVGLVE